MYFRHKLDPLYLRIRNFFTVTCNGLENISGFKNYIFAMNHQSVLDVPLALSFLAPTVSHRIHLLLSHRFYYLLWPITKSLGMIPINMNRDSGKFKDYNLKQLNQALQKLKAGDSILIYPEGIITGGKNSQIIRGQSGVIRLALVSGVPIIPIGINGSNLVYPFLLENKNPFYLRSSSPIKIEIGKKISLKKYPHFNLNHFSKSNKKLLRRLTDDLMISLSRLSGLPCSGLFRLPWRSYINS